MNHWMWPVSLVGILSTAVVLGTDMFFLTIGRPALRLASPSAGTEVMGFFHMFGHARMPIWGVAAILSNVLLAVLSRSEISHVHADPVFRRYGVCCMGSARASAHSLPDRPARRF